LKIYIVQKGDTLWEIAKENHVDFEEIIKLNPQLSSPDMIMPGMKIKIPSVSQQIKTEGSQSAIDIRKEKDERNAQSANRPMAKDISDVRRNRFPKQIISTDNIPEYPLGNMFPSTKETPGRMDNEGKKEKLPMVDSLKNEKQFAKVNIKEKKMQQQTTIPKQYEQKQMMPNMKELNRGQIQMMQQPMMQQPMMQQPMMQQPMMQTLQMQNQYGYCCYCLQPMYRADPRFFSYPYDRRESMYNHFRPTYVHHSHERREY